MARARLRRGASGRPGGHLARAARVQVPSHPAARRGPQPRRGRCGACRGRPCPPSLLATDGMASGARARRRCYVGLARAASRGTLEPPAVDGPLQRGRSVLWSAPCAGAAASARHRTDSGAGVTRRRERRHGLAARRHSGRAGSDACHRAGRRMARRLRPARTGTSRHMARARDVRALGIGAVVRRGAVAAGARRRTADRGGRAARHRAHAGVASALGARPRARRRRRRRAGPRAARHGRRAAGGCRVVRRRGPHPEPRAAGAGVGGVHTGGLSLLMDLAHVRVLAHGALPGHPPDSTRAAGCRPRRRRSPICSGGADTPPVPSSTTRCLRHRPTSPPDSTRPFR